MKKLFRRLLPLTSLLCLPLLGSYHPVASRAGLSLNEAQLAGFNRPAAYQAQVKNCVKNSNGTSTCEYQFTLLFPAPIEGVNDWFNQDDLRFFSMLTNFRCGTLNRGGCSRISSRIVALTTTGQNYINTLGPGNGAYAPSRTYPGYGRFHFNTNKNKVWDFYGRTQSGDPLPAVEYLKFVNRDLLVRATGVPTPGLPANPAGW